MKGFKNPLLGEARPEYGTSDAATDVSVLTASSSSSWRVYLGHPSFPSHLTHASPSHPPYSSRPRLSNKVSTTKYTPLTFLPKCLLSQFRRFANVYFLFQCLVMFVGEYSTLFATPLSPWSMLAVLCFVLGVVMLFELRDDVFRHKNDIATNTRSVSYLSSTLQQSPRSSASESSVSSLNSPNGVDEHMKWQDVCVGDVLLLTNKESLPADVVLLASSERESVGYVETSNIDGETNLKLRFPASTVLAEQLCEGLHDDDLNLLRQRLFQLNAMCTYDPPNKHISSFNGVFSTSAGAVPLGPSNLLLRGSVVRNTRWLIGLVVYTGKDTKVMQNSRETPSKMSRIERVINEALHTVVFGQCILVTAAAICKVVWSDQNVRPNPQNLWYLFPPGTDANSSFTLPDWMASWLTFFVLFNNFVPVNLYVIMEMCNLLQGYLINQDLQMYDVVTDTPARSRTNNLCQELGQVEYVFSDKTGTLTQNSMKFKRCSVGGVQYGKMEASGFSGAKDIQAALQNTSAEVCCWEVLSRPGHERSPPRGGGGAEASDYQAVLLEAFLTVLSVSHTVVAGEEDGVLKYQAESPDEAALVKGAKLAGFKFCQREGHRVLIDKGPEGHSTRSVYEILAVNAFNSTRKRMSTIVRCPSGHLVLLCKGADNVMFAKATKSSEDSKLLLQEHLNEFAVQGLRTLLVGCRVLSPEEYSKWKVRYDAATLSLVNRNEMLADVAEDIEVEMMMLGATAIEDKLQDGVPDTIHDLAEAGIKLWVLTGDKTETAINIGYSCQLLRPNMSIARITSTEKEHLKSRLQSLAQSAKEDRKSLDATVPRRDDGYAAILEDMPLPQGVSLDHLALVITGGALGVIMEDTELKDLLASFAKSCAVVIACRVSPLQKAQIVRMVKVSVKPTPVTLAIGDGANDVGMIQEADVGIGISGKEGMQAVNGSDFAIAQFRFLHRLLLVHGRWNYRRMSKVVVYSFYKNFCITLTLFFFNFITAYSGTSLYEEMMYNGFNIFTMLPIISVGVLDQDVKASTALKYPALYMSGRLNLDLNTRVVTEAIIVAIIHSLVVFLWPLFALSGLDQSALGGLYVFGTSVFCCLFFAMQYRVMLLTSTWTKVTLLVHFLSYVLFFAFLFLYSLMWMISPQFYYVPFILMREGFFWAVVFGVPATTLAIDYVFSYFRREYFPHLIDVAMDIDRKQLSQQRVAFRSIVQHINPKGNRPTPLHMQHAIVLPITKPIDIESKEEDGRRGSAIQAPFVPGFAFSHPDETRQQTLLGLLGKSGHSSSSSMGGNFDESTLSMSPRSLTFRKRRRKKALKHSNRPSESRFYQQTMLAWQPGLSPRRVIVSLLAVSIFFISIGFAVTTSSNQVVEAGVQYAGVIRPHYEHAQGATWSYQPCTSQKCTVKIAIPEVGMKAPIYVLYGLTDFYQNYLRYTLSLDTWQLMGYERDITSLEQRCRVQYQDEKGRTMLPCGLQAHSMFNDTFVPTNTSISINDRGIAWKSDIEVKYANPEGFPRMCNESACLSEFYPGVVKKNEGVLNEHFIVWMRLAALPNFRKLYGRIEEDLPGGSELELTVENSFPVDSFGGSKSVLLNTESWMGGKNLFLGWVYVASGCLSFVCAVAITVKQGCTPRKVEASLNAIANRDQPAVNLSPSVNNDK